MGSRRVHTDAAPLQDNKAKNNEQENYYHRTARPRRAERINSL